MVSFSALLQEGRAPTRREEISAVLALSWPAIVQQLMLTLVQYIDTAMVGSLGPNATASVGVVSSSVWLFNGLLGAARSGGPLRAGQHAARYGHHDGYRPSDVPFRRAAHRDVHP